MSFWVRYRIFYPPSLVISNAVRDLRLSAVYRLPKPVYTLMSDKLQELIQQIIAFRDARDWKQFHNPKDLAISLVLEAGEVMEHFQWKNAEEMEKHVEEHRDDIGDELADVLAYMIMMAHDLNIDLLEALERKMEENNKKYPADKVRGTHKKYTEL